MSDFIARKHRSVKARASGTHEIYAGEIFIARHHAYKVFAGNIHEAGQTGTGTHKETFEAHFLEAFHRKGLPYHHIRHEFHSHTPQGLNLNVDHAVGETEFGYAVFQHAAYLVESLEHRHIVAARSHVACKRKPGWPTSGHSNLAFEVFRARNGSIGYFLRL